jgi:hypothetical protein
MRTSKKYQGTKIVSAYESSNIKLATYDTKDLSLIIEFTNGAKYLYKEVPHKVFTAFDETDSQGKYFNKEIARKYVYERQP